MLMNDIMKIAKPRQTFGDQWFIVDMILTWMKAYPFEMKSHKEAACLWDFIKHFIQKLKVVDINDIVKGYD